KIAFVGAGNVASNLGTLFSAAGHEVKYATPNPKEGQLSIPEVCNYGTIVCFAIPFGAMKDVLTDNAEALAGKIVIDITNAIHLEDWSPIFLGEESGAELASRLVPESRLVKAFNTIFADVMHPEKQQIKGQKLTCFIASNDSEALGIVEQLSQEAGFHSVAIKGLKNARHLEAMAHLNIAIALGGGGTAAGFVYLQSE
ncbi:MAG: NAD(P)-binding domain-containing protein, partial [Bacteroidota bacterium]